mmetsp:Transcript_879/g.2335  ORF Transcript_879/g.2335 Transcript_879/m.2335 type:complete len:230 (+) Transcript_879:1193-1882(+)
MERVRARRSIHSSSSWSFDEGAQANLLPVSSTTSSTRSSTTSSSPRALTIESTVSHSINSEGATALPSLRDRSATNSAPAKESMPRSDRDAVSSISSTPRASRAALDTASRVDVADVAFFTVVGAFVGTTSAGVASATHRGTLQRSARRTTASAPMDGPRHNIQATSAPRVCCDKAAHCAKAFDERLTTRTHAPRTKTTSAFGMGLSSHTEPPAFSAASLSETGACLET